MGRTTPTPADVGGVTAAAVAESHKLAAERKCADAVNKAYAWIDRHPSVVEAGAELFAAQAITFRRVPADVVAAGGGAIEAWLLESWASRSSVGERAA